MEVAKIENAQESIDHWSIAIGRRAPNVITIIRLLLVPIFVYILIDPTPRGNLWAFAIFAVASFTDWLDGYLARIYNAKSILGTLLDPIADKVLIMAALVMLATVPNEPRLPAWMVVIFLARETVVGGLRSIAAVSGLVVPASRWAKHKTAWQMGAIGYLLIREPYEIFGFLINFHYCGIVFLSIALLFSVGTGIAYARALSSIWSEETAVQQAH